jgi:hypothetical protein
MQYGHHAIPSSNASHDRPFGKAENRLHVEKIKGGALFAHPPVNVAAPLASNKQKRKWPVNDRPITKLTKRQNYLQLSICLKAAEIPDSE